MSSRSTGSAPRSLEEFAASHKKKRCYVCDELPVDIRTELELAKGRHSYTMMIAWLATEHHISTATRHKLEVHWQHAGAHRVDDL